MGCLSVSQHVILDEVLHVLLAEVEGVELVPNLHAHFPAQIPHMDSHGVFGDEFDEGPDRQLDPLELVQVLGLLLLLLLRGVALTLEVLSVVLILPGQVHVDVLREEVLLLTMLITLLKWWPLIEILPLLHTHWLMVG